MDKSIALFDMDGTLVDSEKLWAEAQCLLLEDRNIRFSAANCLSFSYGLAWEDVFAKMQDKWPNAFLDESAERIGVLLSSYFARLFDRQVPVIPGSVTLFKRLASEGWTMAVVSGSPRAMITRTLCKIGLLDQVKLIVSADDVVQGKPHPESYLKAVAGLGADPAQCIAFEDSQVGTQSAHAAGIYTIAYRNPSAPSQDLCAADIILDDLSSWHL